MGLLAEEILRKADFFSLLKGNARGAKDLEQQSKFHQLKVEQSRLSMNTLAKDKATLFKMVEGNSDIESPAAIRPPLPPQPKTSFVGKSSLEASDAEMETLDDVQKEMAKASFIQ